MYCFRHIYTVYMSKAVHLLYTVLYSRYLPAVFRIRIRTDPHKEIPPGSGSAWTDADPDPGGKKA